MEGKDRRGLEADLSEARSLAYVLAHAFREELAPPKAAVERASEWGQAGSLPEEIVAGETWPPARAYLRAVRALHRLGELIDQLRDGKWETDGSGHIAGGLGPWFAETDEALQWLGHYGGEEEAR